LADLLITQSYPQKPQYHKLLFTDQVAGSSDQDRFQAAFTAVANDIALGGGASRQRYTHVGGRAGQVINLESQILVTRRMSSGFIGAGRRESTSVGHNPYVNSTHIVCAAGFPSASVFRLEDNSDCTYSGFSVAGQSTSDRVPGVFGTKSTSGAGTFRLRFENLHFTWVENFGIYMGQYTTAPLLDSDSEYININGFGCGRVDSVSGEPIGGMIRLGHNQSLVHRLQAIGLGGSESGVVLQCDQAAFVWMHGVATTDAGCILRIKKGNSNGGEIHVEHVRCEGILRRTRGLWIDGEAEGGYTDWSMVRVNCNAQFTAPTLFTGETVENPVYWAESRSRFQGTLEKIRGAGSKLIRIRNGADNTEPTHVDVVACNLGNSTLGNATLAGVSSALAGHTVAGFRNYNYTGSGLSRIADGTFAGSGP